MADTKQVAARRRSGSSRLKTVEAIEIPIAGNRIRLATRHAIGPV